MAAMADIEQSEHEAVVSVCRDGPLIDPDFVSAITNIPPFQAAVLGELQGLEVDLSSISTTEFRDELTVDDLRILSEEEVVQRALQEAFKDERVEASFHDAEENNGEMLRNTILESSEMDSCSIDASDLSKRSCESRRSAKVSCGVKKRKNKKKGRAFDREIRAVELEGGYVAKVEELAKIKEKQDEDKAVAKLHSFNGMAEIEELAISTSEKIESMRSLRCITASKKAKSSPTTDYVPICYPDTVITIDIFYSRRKNLKVQEILVLGSQMLTQLRDKINCKMDCVMRKNGLHDTSAYFLIEEISGFIDMFYNDLRNYSAIRYSEPIFQWLRDRKEAALEKWEYIAISAELQKKQRSLLGNESISRLPALRAFLTCTKLVLLT